MTSNSLPRPQRPKSPSKSSSSTQGNQATKRPKQLPEPSRLSSGGGRGNNNGNRGHNNGGNSGNNPSPPSPWLNEKNELSPHPTASFVEYLRWMREPDHQYKDATKVQILQLATEKANYREYLTAINQRIELMAGKNNTFTVKCAWRIRVGGHRGPESILLPAFDALGMPYIPSSTLKGVARTQAIREVMQDKGIEWKKAEQDPEIVKHFGSLEADKQDKAGKVVFFDAYPLPSEHGLAMDMANNIWKWEGNELQYSPNPNPFLSLDKPTFKIGLKLISGIKDPQILEKVRQWLIKGLQTGIGSQVNTGYGEFLVAGKGQPSNEFLRVEFALKGQLIHGCQQFKKIKEPYQKDYKSSQFKTDRNGNLKPDTVAQAEVRPIAFKSMLRYWFRAFALGVLDIRLVQDWEGKLFGAIQPNRQDGWIKFSVQDGKTPSKSNNDCGEQEGILIVSYMPNLPEQYKSSIITLFNHLIWIMFHIGGIGQGARRPLYKRSNFPSYRGSTIYIKEPEDFAKFPSNINQFCEKFKQNIRGFYEALSQLTNQSNLNPATHQPVFNVSSHQWAEIVDQNCQILVINKKTENHKPYALDVLHQQFHNLESEMKQLQEESKKLKSKNPEDSRKKAHQAKQQYSEMKSLCGEVNTDFIYVNNQRIERKVVPSPIWI